MRYGVVPEKIGPLPFCVGTGFGADVKCFYKKRDNRCTRITVNKGSSEVVVVDEFASALAGLS